VRVTAVVCTHNRGPLLATCLRSLAQQELASGAHEILVVDNASTDETPRVIDAVRAELGTDRLRSVREPELGLSAARNAAIREATGEVLAFVDDDAEPAPGWLEALARALESPEVWAAGGPVELEPTGAWPSWLSPRLRPYLAEWDRGTEPATLRYDDYPRGVNLAFRRETFEMIGGFSTRLGRKGGALLSYEEVELCYRVEQAGGLVQYAPGARVRHAVATERLSPRWFRRRLSWQGRSLARFDAMHRRRPALLRARLSALVASWRAPAGADSPAQVAVYRRCHGAMLRGYLVALPAALARPAVVPRPPVRRPASTRA
jgi:GT2 family glycosyltransferase